MASWWISFLSAVPSADITQPDMRDSIPCAGIWVTSSAWGCLFILAAPPGARLWLHGWHRSGSYLSQEMSPPNFCIWEVPGPQSCVWAVPLLIHDLISLWDLLGASLSFQAKRCLVLLFSVVQHCFRQLGFDALGWNWKEFLFLKFLNKLFVIIAGPLKTTCTRRVNVWVF